MTYYCRTCGKSYSELEAMIRFLHRDTGGRKAKCSCGNNLTNCKELFKYRLFWNFNCDDCGYRFKCYTNTPL